MTKLIFQRKRMPIYAEHRPLYKIVQILLVLKLASRGKKSSLLKLQLFNWALKDNSRMNKLIDAAKSGRLEVNVWGMDPALNVAIQFAISESLVEQVVSNVIITKKGECYLDLILKEDLLLEEKKFFSDIKNKITEKMIAQVVNSWG